MKVYEALNLGKKMILKRAGNRHSAYREAIWLLSYCMNVPSSVLFVSLREPLPEEISGEFLRLAKKRASGHPLQYLTGTASFFGRDFHAAEGVLIPREDTGVLVEAVLRNFKQPPEPCRAADAGCGSGIISITLLLCGIKPSKFELYDISPQAIICARRNAEKHGVRGKITFRKGDFFALTARKRRYFDLIVSNPPYIKKGAKKRIAREVLMEPAKALFAGKDGLAFYRKLSKTAHLLLKRGGILALETGAGMEKQVLKLFKEKFQHIESAADRHGKVRAVMLKLIDDR